jgi:predicted TIM-barrel fold metal-dependent hydrolase
MRDGDGLYDGPIIDAHHHLWDRSMGRHAWLRAHEEGPLGRSCMPQDYLRDTRGFNVVATVHVEANWDPSDPLGEIAWLDGLARPEGMAARYVGHADLRSPRSEGVIEAFAAHGNVVGIRDIVSWHPDPARSHCPDRHRMADPAWREGLRRLARHDLSFDLAMSPWQIDDALALLSDFPDARFALNHCGSPFDRTPEGLRHWADGLRQLAVAPNIVIKISDPVAYDPTWSIESLRYVLRTCLDAFGPGRCMLGSDHPVVALHATFAQIYDAYRTIFADLDEADAHAIFAGNAAAFYKVSHHPPQQAGFP